MKRFLFLYIAVSLMIGACMPAVSQPQEGPTPISESDLQATAAIISQQTLQALPTATARPSETPVVVTPSQTAIQATATETVNPAFLTLTATLLAGTPTLGTESAVTGTAQTGAPTDATVNSTATSGTPQPLFYGTLPPKLPYGTIDLFNKAQVDVYISMRCVTKDGYVTILEYPVKKNFKVSAPAGKYTYIAWVGGRQFDGSFSMDNDGFITITFFKDRINVKKD
jgi:hypothetical protein